MALITCSDLEPCDGGANGANDAGKCVALGIGDRECVERGRATSGFALYQSDGAGKTGNYRWLATKKETEKKSVKYKINILYLYHYYII